MSRLQRLAVFAAAVVAVGAGAPEGAEAGRHRGQRGSQGSRVRTRDHRASAPRPQGGRPHYRRPHYHYYAPYYYGGYYPYGTYWVDGYYSGPPAAAQVIVAPRPRPRTVVAMAVHLGQIAQEDESVANVAGLAVRLRGAIFEGELEIGRRSYLKSDVEERSVAATLYANLGYRDSLHAYVLGGVGMLEGDRGFGQIGIGLALPIASRLTLGGDVRASSISAGDERIEDVEAVEGRVGLVLDF